MGEDVDIVAGTNAGVTGIYAGVAQGASSFISTLFGSLVVRNTDFRSTSWLADGNCVARFGEVRIFAGQSCTLQCSEADGWTGDAAEISCSQLADVDPAMATSGGPVWHYLFLSNPACFASSGGSSS